MQALFGFESMAQGVKRTHEGLILIKRDGKSGAPLRIGTDFSGIEAPLIALRKLGVAYVSVFACDNNGACKKIIKHCFNPQFLYADIKGRDIASMPSVDVYIFGFPCQPYSTAGKQQGVMDERGLLVTYCLEYIREKRPKCILAENVDTIVKRHFKKEKRNRCQHRKYNSERNSTLLESKEHN